LLKPPEKTSDDGFQVYTYVLFRNFFVSQGELIEGGGGNMPAVLTMKEFEDGWDVEVKTPTPGNQWGSSIRELFPEDVWHLLFQSPPIPYDLIKKDIVHQAEKHFGLIFDPDKNSFPPAEPSGTPPVLILTITPSPTLDIYSLEPDVTGQVFVRSNSITIQVDLYPEVARQYYKGLLSAGWRVHLYQRQVDGNYSIQNALSLSELKESENQHEFTVRISLEDVQHAFDNRRDLIYQIVDQDGVIAWQDDLYLPYNLSQYSQEGIPEDTAAIGWATGKPNLMDQDQHFYTNRQEEYFQINGIHGGFYELIYTFNLSGITGITTTEELIAFGEELLCELFVVQDDGKIAAGNPVTLPGYVISIAGLYEVRFPFEWLANEQNQAGSYYLKITDGGGRIIKEDFFRFFPYTP
jgi:hypothetical protein